MALAASNSKSSSLVLSRGIFYCRALIALVRRRMASLLSLPLYFHFSPRHARENNLSFDQVLTHGLGCWKTSYRNLGHCKIQCGLSMVKRASSSEKSVPIVKEPHKYFDQVIVTVRAGDGGHGAVLKMPNQRADNSRGKYHKEKNKKRASSPKRDFDGSLILPVGGHGGDVVIYADEGKDNLLEFHNQRRYHAKRGGNVDSTGALTSQLHDGLASPTLRIPVPVGTVVKHKRGKLLADLARPGDEVLVARGGQGGISLLEVPENRRKKMMSLTTNVMRDDSDKVLVHGQPGEEVSLELILQVVADVGLVGLPNAGKSTLLAAITRAKPDIADYPFTTLMPNLGRLDGDPLLGPDEFSSEVTLADLPGLIEGAHFGKGLGRNFLRHLRRTRLLVHVVDAAAENPVHDYKTVREELWMYNPDYVARPFIVVLNKIDLPQASDRLPYITGEILKAEADKIATEPRNYSAVPEASKMNKNEEQLKDNCRPLAIVAVSVLRGIRVDEMLEEIRGALRMLGNSNGNT